MSRSFNIRNSFVFTVLAGILLAAGAPVLAADVEKKFRLGFMAGGYNADDKVGSNSANVLVLRDPDDFSLDAAYLDPRNDSAAFGTLGFTPGILGTLMGQYAVSKIFILEASIGYHSTDLGDVEVAADFSGSGTPNPSIPFDFDIFKVNAGTLTRVPIQFTALARLRPRARFNPYFGAGIGYAFMGYEASSEFNALSSNMDNVFGQFQALLSLQQGGGLLPIGPELDLTGAEVDIRDSFEWHLAAGAELGIKKNWSMVFDVRWIDASADVNVKFNGSNELGSSVPQFEDFTGSPVSFETFGPVRISTDGLVDGGQTVVVPRGTEPLDTDCALTPSLCTSLFFSKDTSDPDRLNYDDPRLEEINFQPDGLPDPGRYYVQGGNFSWDGFSAQIGFRYTF